MERVEKQPFVYGWNFKESKNRVERRYIRVTKLVEDFEKGTYRVLLPFRKLISLGKPTVILELLLRNGVHAQH